MLTSRRAASLAAAFLSLASIVSLAPSSASAQVSPVGAMGVSDHSPEAGLQARIWTGTILGQLASKEEAGDWTIHVERGVTGGVAAVRLGASPWTEHAFYVRDGRVRRLRLADGDPLAEQTLPQPVDSSGRTLSLSFTQSDVAVVDYERGPMAVAAISTDGRLCVWRVALTTASARPSCSARNTADREADVAGSPGRWAGHLDAPAFYYRSTRGTLRRATEDGSRWGHVDLGSPGAEIGGAIFTVREQQDTVVGVVSGNRLHFAHLDSDDPRAFFQAGPALPDGVTIASFGARADAARSDFYNPGRERWECRIVVYAATSNGLFTLTHGGTGTGSACPILRPHLGRWSPIGHPPGLRLGSIGVASEVTTPFGSSARVFGAASLASYWFITALVEHRTLGGWQDHTD